MLKIISRVQLIVVCSLMSAQVHASSEFSKLTDAFQTAELPPITTIQNTFFSGRCFEPGHPDTPLAAAFLFRRTKHYRDEDPLHNIDKVSLYEARFKLSRSMPHDFYDSKNLDIFENRPLFPVKVHSDTLSYEFKAYGRQYYSSTRAKSGYLLEQHYYCEAGWDNEGYVDINGNWVEQGHWRECLNSGVWAMCYYFNPENQVPGTTVF